MEDRLPRKLTAILYADVAGYSRLISEDEEGAHRRLRDSPYTSMHVYNILNHWRIM